MIDDLLAEYEALGVRFISLDDALEDSVYRIDPRFARELGRTFLEQVRARPRRRRPRLEVAAAPRDRLALSLGALDLQLKQATTAVLAEARAGVEDPVGVHVADAHGLGRRGARSCCAQKARASRGAKALRRARVDRERPRREQHEQRAREQHRPERAPASAVRVHDGARGPQREHERRRTASSAARGSAAGTPPARARRRTPPAPSAGPRRARIASTAPNASARDRPGEPAAQPVVRAVARGSRARPASRLQTKRSPEWKRFHSAHRRREAHRPRRVGQPDAAGCTTPESASTSRVREQAGRERELHRVHGIVDTRPGFAPARRRARRRAPRPSASARAREKRARARERGEATRAGRADQRRDRPGLELRELRHASAAIEQRSALAVGRARLALELRERGQREREPAGREQIDVARGEVEHEQRHAEQRGQEPAQR